MHKDESEHVLCKIDFDELPATLILNWFHTTSKVFLLICFLKVQHSEFFVTIL